MRIAPIIAAVLAATTAARAQGTPDSENGRYTFKPVAEGVLRLDTRSGQVSTCSNTAGNWACYATPDERAALDAEIGRLQAENERLSAQLAKSGGQQEANKDSSLTPRLPRNPDGSRKLEIPLPSDQDIDRAMGFLEKVWRRLVEMTGRLQKEEGKL